MQWPQYLVGDPRMVELCWEHLVVNVPLKHLKIIIITLCNYSKTFGKMKKNSFKFLVQKWLRLTTIHSIQYVL